MMCSTKQTVILRSAYLTEEDDVGAAEAFLLGAEQKVHHGEDVEVPAFVPDTAANFILGATYHQEDVPQHLRGLPDDVISAYCQGRCITHHASGFFFQTHKNGHEIVGFYQSVAAMKGQRVWHDHARGFLSFHPRAFGADAVAVDVDNNFLLGCLYQQEEIPAGWKNQPLPVTLEWCVARARARQAAGFFFQEHTNNGHEIVGFYASAEAMARGEPSWHGHARGSLVAIGGADCSPLLAGAPVPDGPLRHDETLPVASGNVVEGVAVVGSGLAEEVCDGDKEDDGWVVVDGVKAEIEESVQAKATVQAKAAVKDEEGVQAKGTAMDEVD